MTPPNPAPATDYGDEIRVILPNPEKLAALVESLQSRADQLAAENERLTGELREAKNTIACMGEWLADANVKAASERGYDKLCAVAADNLARAEQAQAALRMVEWVEDQGMEVGMDKGCPWCHGGQPWHEPDCPRQLALGEAVSGAQP